MKSNIVFTVALLLAVAGCDNAVTDGYRQERSEKNYRLAMDEYRAGRIDEAVKALSEAIRLSPGNASARFQLAVMLQESKKDYLGALCNYTEYIRIAEDSGKAGMARDRMLICEKMLVGAIAAENGLDANAATLKELELARAELSKAEKRIAELSAGLEENGRRIKTLERENASLSRMIKRLGDSEDEGVSARPAPARRDTVIGNAVEADSGAPVKPAVKPVAAEEREPEKPLSLNPEAKALFEEEEREAKAAGSDLLPPQTPKPVVEKKPEPASPSAFYRNPSMPEKPEFYVVQEGDTLMKIAKRFYGDRSKWSMIRNANKGVVPMSGVIKVGDRLRLP